MSSNELFFVERFKSKRARIASMKLNINHCIMCGFASARCARIASRHAVGNRHALNTLPQHAVRGLRRLSLIPLYFPHSLCLSTLCADCVGKDARSRTQFYVHCAVSRYVSFSDKRLRCLISRTLLLPKHLVNAICGSPGRTIDRIAGCEHPADFTLTYGSHDTHTGRSFGTFFQLFNDVVVECYKIFIIEVEHIDVITVSCFVHVLQQKRGIQISLDPSAVGHFVPSLTQWLFYTFSGDMVELTCLCLLG